MRKRWLVLLSLVLMQSPALAGEAGNYIAPRGPGGKPDLNGIWRVMNRANDNLEAHPAEAALAYREGPINPVPAKEVVALGAVGAVPAGVAVVDGGKIPYTDAARKQQEENRANWLARDPEIKCYLPGIPRATYMPYAFQILHNKDALFFAYEYAGAARNIHLRDPGPAPIDSWMGQSFGQWEGDTLVVETTGQHAQSWLDRAGNFHSESLRVIERFTPTSAHTMDYQATLEDEQVYTRPFTIRMPLYRLVGADARLQQFNCVPFVEELLYGHLRKEPLE